VSADKTFRDEKKQLLRSSMRRSNQRSPSNSDQHRARKEILRQDRCDDHRRPTTATAPDFERRRTITNDKHPCASFCCGA